MWVTLTDAGLNVSWGLAVSLVKQLDSLFPKKEESLTRLSWTVYKLIS